MAAICYITLLRDPKPEKSTEEDGRKSRIVDLLFKSNNTSKSNDCGSRFEGSLPQSGVVRQAGRGLEFDGSVPQSGIMRRGGRGYGIEKS